MSAYSVFQLRYFLQIQFTFTRARNIFAFDSVCAFDCVCLAYEDMIVGFITSADMV